MQPLITLASLAAAAAFVNCEQTPLVGHDDPLAVECSGYSFPAVVCLRKRGAVIRGDWERPVTNDIAHADTFRSTRMPQESSFRHVRDADFVVWDEKDAKHVLGAAPAVDFILSTKGLMSHEAPVWSPETNELYLARLEHRFLPQLVIDLNQDPPVLREKIANPPIYGAVGGRYYNGLLYFSTLGGDENIDGRSYRPGIYTLNATSGESQVLLNNYYGYYFIGADDFDIDRDGHIWFTDNDYGRPTRLNSYAPQINPATYRFNPSTGFVTVVEDTLVEPNGAQFSPDGRTLYLTDTGAGEAVIDPAVDPVPPIKYNSTGKRSIYAFDVDPVRKILTNKRPFHQSMQLAPDGIKVSEDGYVIAATGNGITILSPEGAPVVLVQTNFTVINIAWVGHQREELWAVGKGGIARVRLGLRGPKLA
ncbi:Six-bladed beta-propeller TolB-like protein [Macrophomina phaseolina MS6]|uniref:Six-bladed beta-propeller TolB-like protein n=1 Tax=Macrophomina phaseolina (strain MS6) TaxID=1126212 RepID=K2T0X4_MACPH|nr:Six-bladed beta-propeller TolB-like protein [Macrophomina phaseolina MS6]